MQGKTLIIALESVFHYDPETGCGLRPTTAALLSDYRALGYSLVAIADRNHFGLESEAECTAFAELVDRSLRSKTGVGFTTVVTLADRFDPRPIWEAARRHSLDLTRSILLTDEGTHAGICRTSGVPRVESSAYLLSLT